MYKLWPFHKSLGTFNGSQENPKCHVTKEYLGKGRKGNATSQFILSSTLDKT